MSQTESEAIDSGDTWWDAELFQGSPDWEQLLSYPKPILSEKEQAFIENQTETLCAMLDDWQITHHDLDMPKEVWDYIKKERFFAMLIPESYGGLGFSAYANSTIVHKIATRSATAAVTIMVPNSLGPAELLLKYGTQSQKDYYLPRLATAEDIPCFALTSEEAGSDATAMVDKGVVCYGEHQGKEVLGLKLTWSKRYITLAPIATVLGLAVKLYDPEKLLGNQEELGITLCLLPTNHPGVEVGKRHFPLNQSFMNGPTRGQDVFVPMDWIIGGQSMIGKGWRMLVECLSAGRGISLPALATSAGKSCYRMTGAYALVRKQFRLSIGKFGGIEAAMARIAGFTYLLEAARHLTVTGIDEGKKPAIVTAIAKYHMTEMARQLMNDAMDVHAGRGIMMGPRNYLARGFQSLPISITVEGANILTRNLMIFGQGVIRCHPYVLTEIQAANDPNVSQGLKVFDKTLFSHVGYLYSNSIRLFTNSVLGAVFCSAPKQHGGFRRYYQKLGHMSLALSVVSDISLLILGGKLKRLERLSARLGDVLSYLYLASAALKYQQDYESELKNRDYLEWSLQWCLYQCQEALYDFFDNFPNCFVAFKLKKNIFPFGKKYKKPSDKLEHRLVVEMLSNSTVRETITRHSYVGADRDCPSGRMEIAFRELLKVQEVLKKIQQAISAGVVPKNVELAVQIRVAVDESIINQEEAQLIQVSDELCQDAIRVDEFSHEQLIGNR